MSESKVAEKYAPKRPKTGGRKAGTPNKMTATLKEMAIGALEKAGGQAWFERLARENPVAFANFLAKFVPTEISGGLDVKITEVQIDI